MLKIIFSDNVEHGLPDHLIDETCRQILERLEKNPTNSFVHRTGQRLVWHTFVSLIENEYYSLHSQIEWYNS